MNAKVELSVLGFSFNQSKSGTYGLVLSETDGLRRLMIVVGTPEAQSIAFRLHNALPPRPLTHDLFGNVLDKFRIGLKEVYIYKYEDGVFFSRLLLEQYGHTIEVESRTSDAVAIALRTSSPIYTNEEIMQQLAIVVKENDSLAAENRALAMEDIRKKDYNHYSVLSSQELRVLLKDALDIEDYELATVLRDELKKKQNRI